MFTLSENTTVKARMETGGHTGPRKGARQSSERLFWCEGKVRRRGRTTQSSLCAFSMTRHFTAVSAIKNHFSLDEGTGATLG